MSESDAELAARAAEWYPDADDLADNLAVIRSWFAKAPRERFTAIVCNLLVEDTLLRECGGWGLVSEQIPGTLRRRFHLITDGSISGCVTAHDHASRDVLPSYANRSETSVEVDLSVPPLVMAREVHAWLMAVHAFLTHGAYSEPIEWRTIPSARMTE